MYQRMLTAIALAVILILPHIPAQADTMAGYKVREVNQDFDSTLFELTNAIVNRGLVIDYTGHVSKMLERTSQATGGSSPYKHARYLNFCSAKLSAAAMQADPDNLAVCPYVVFAYELKSKPGITRIGYRRPVASEKASAKQALMNIEKLLDGIIADAAN